MRQARDRVVIIGVGNPDRGDDAAGLAVVRRVGAILAASARGCPPGNVAVLEHQGDAATLMDAWEGAQAVILVDAVVSGAPPGTIHRIDASREPIPAVLRCRSTHAFGVAEAVGLARAMGWGPSRVMVYGIEGASFAPGQALSAVVSSVLDTAARRVLDEARGLAAAAGPLAPLRVSAG